MPRKMTSLLLAALLLFGLAACNKTESSQPEVQTPVSSTPQVEEPEPEFDVTTSAFLTGLQKSAGYPEGQRVAAVMVGNDRGAWPHQGLSEASLLIEAIVDDWYITRMVAVYEDYTTMPDVRPVRSARDQLYQMVAPLYPLFVHDGPGDRNQPIYQMMREVEAEEFDFWPGSFLKGSAVATARTSSYSEPYNEYTNGSLLAKAVESAGVDDARQYNSPIFDFVPYDQPKRIPEEGTATDVTIRHNSANRTGFTWNGQQYVLSMNNSSGAMQTLTDGNNSEEVAFDNVLVVFAPVGKYSSSVLLKFEYNVGTGYYFSEGCWEPFLWQKAGVGGMLRLINLEDGETSFQINPGTTYIAVVDDKMQEDFDAQIRYGSGGGNDENGPTGSVD